MSFTMEEYCKQHGLEWNPKDTAKLKLVAGHLRKLGYHRQRVRNGTNSWYVWTKNDRKVELDAFSKQLEALEKNGGKSNAKSR